MKIIGKKEKYSPIHLTCLTQTEFEAYLQKKKLPNEEILKDRYQSSILYFSNGKYDILTGAKTLNLEKLIHHTASAGSKEIKGISAYKGVVVGKVRIVHDPHNISFFNKGDILVTGMTRPEFLPIAHKAKAIITDAGGILCHAAIISRELKIPCIVGTQVATTTLKDGDIVEVDANKSIIKII